MHAYCMPIRYVLTKISCQTMPHGRECGCIVLPFGLHWVIPLTWVLFPLESGFSPMNSCLVRKSVHRGLFLWTGRYQTSKDHSLDIFPRPFEPSLYPKQLSLSYCQGCVADSSLAVSCFLGCLLFLFPSCFCCIYPSPAKTLHLQSNLSPTSGLSFPYRENPFYCEPVKNCRRKKFGNWIYQFFKIVLRAEFFWEDLKIWKMFGMSHFDMILIQKSVFPGSI